MLMKKEIVTKKRQLNNKKKVIYNDKEKIKIMKFKY